MRVRGALLGLLGAALILLNARLYERAPRGGAEALDEVGPQIAWLNDQIESGAPERMQALFPEGYLFTHALVGLAAAELALENPGDAALRARSRAIAERSLDAARSSAGRAPFDPGLTPPYGAFYAGWTTWLEGAVVALGGTVEPYAADCEAIAQAHRPTRSPFQASYPGQVWPVDSVVAMSALSVCDGQLGTDHAGLLRDWVARARERLDSRTGMLPHTADADRGRPTSGPRGTSMAMMLRFLAEIEPGFAEEQYRLFRKTFVVRRAFLPGILEFPDGRPGGDVDSGPLIRGVSLSASAVAAGAAKLHGDAALADSLFGAGEALGFPLQLAGKKRYALGAMPVGDAFGAWSKTARPWRWPPIQVADSELGPWRLFWHGVSAVVFQLALLLAWLTRSR